MDNSTIVAIAAIVTTGVTTGIAAPGITAWATSRGQKRKFLHERFFRDSAEVREHIDRNLEAFDDLLRCLVSLALLIPKVGVGPASVMLIKEVEESVEGFEESTSRLTIRIGPGAQLTALCGVLVDISHKAKQDLVMNRALEHILGGEGLDVDQRAELTEQQVGLISNLGARAQRLREIRPQYLAAANELAGMMTAPIASAS